MSVCYIIFKSEKGLYHCVMYLRKVKVRNRWHYYQLSGCLKIVGLLRSLKVSVCSMLFPDDRIDAALGTSPSQQGAHAQPGLDISANTGILQFCNTQSCLYLYNCAGSSEAVHNVVLIDVYLDLENPGGSGFWVGENRWVTEGTKRVSLRASGSRGGRILTQQGRVPSK